MTETSEAQKKKRSRSHEPSKVIPFKRVDAAADIAMNPAQGDDYNILYRHASMCQTFIPYRDPGNDVIEYTQRNGDIVLAIDAQKITRPDGTRDYIGLPFGPKARLAMLHIDSMAILQKTPHIEVKDSMTAFVTETLGLSNSGYNIQATKEQLARLAACKISVAKIIDHGNQTQVKHFNTQLIDGFDLWFPKDENQRVLWSSVMELSPKYFESLMAHAVPHDMRMVGALANNAMALDVLSWLTQRLHRVDRAKPSFIAWAQLKVQFGGNYERMADFKKAFRRTLKLVLMQYQDARIEEDRNKGFLLYNSKPPIPYKATPLIHNPR